MDNNLLKIEELYVNAEDKEILKGINLNINKGEVHVIMGPNGSGKTTTANAILNNPAYTKKSGKVIFDNTDITNEKTDEIARKGKEINEKERPNDVYIIDSRLAWSNVPDSYAIRLTVNEAIAGKRVFYDTTRGSEDQYETVDEAIQKTRKRKLGEIERYKEKYGINLLDENNYDLVVDTSYTNTQELADIIVSGEEAYRTGKSYPKYWANPTCAER